MYFKSVENSCSRLTPEVLIKLIFVENDSPSNVSGYQVGKILSGLWYPPSYKLQEMILEIKALQAN